MGLFQPHGRHGDGDGAAGLNAPAPRAIRAIVIADAGEASIALAAAAALDREVALISAPGAAAYLGAAFFQGCIDRATRDVAGARARAILDCGDRAGDVMAALRAGVTAVRFTGAAEVAAKLADMAAKAGVAFIVGPVEALDLAQARDKRAACERFLAHD